MGTGASVPENSNKSGKTRGKNATKKNSRGAKKTTGTASTNKNGKSATAVRFDPVETKIPPRAADRRRSPVSNERGTKKSSSKVRLVSPLVSQPRVELSDGAKSQIEVKRQSTAGNSDRIKNRPPKQTSRTQYVRSRSPDDPDFESETRPVRASPTEVNRPSPLANGTSRSDTQISKSLTVINRTESKAADSKSINQGRPASGLVSPHGTSETASFCPQCLHCQHSEPKKLTMNKQPPWILKKIDEIPRQHILMDKLDEEAMQLTRMTVYSSNRSRHSTIPYLVMDKQEPNETLSFNFGSWSTDSRVDLSIRPIYTPYRNL